jgi:hypothetical protein
MMSPIRRIASAAALALPLAATLSLPGCNSPLAPPDPIVDKDTVTNDNEGVTGRRLQDRSPIPMSEIMKALEAYRCMDNEGCQ